MKVDQMPTATFDSVMKALHGVMSSACYAWLLLEAAAKVCEEAEDMIAAGAVGDVVRDTLRHAAELVEVADEELSDAQTDRCQVLAAASPCSEQGSARCAVRRAYWQSQQQLSQLLIERSLAIENSLRAQLARERSPTPSGIPSENSSVPAMPIKDVA
jgi:hypothetical protein